MGKPVYKTCYACSACPPGHRVCKDGLCAREEGRAWEEDDNRRMYSQTVERPENQRKAPWDADRPRLALATYRPQVTPRTTVRPQLVDIIRPQIPTMRTTRPQFIQQTRDQPQLAQSIRIQLEQQLEAEADGIDLGHLPGWG